MHIWDTWDDSEDDDNSENLAGSRESPGSQNEPEETYCEHFPDDSENYTAAGSPKNPLHEPEEQDADRTRAIKVIRALIQKYSVRAYGLFDKHHYIKNPSGCYFEETCPFLTSSQLPPWRDEHQNSFAKWRLDFSRGTAVLYYIVINDVPKVGFSMNAKLRFSYYIEKYPNLAKHLKMFILCDMDKDVSTEADRELREIAKKLCQKLLRHEDCPKYYKYFLRTLLERGANKLGMDRIFAFKLVEAGMQWSIDGMAVVAEAFICNQKVIDKRKKQVCVQAAAVVRAMKKRKNDGRLFFEPHQIRAIASWKVGRGFRDDQLSTQICGTELLVGEKWKDAVAEAAKKPEDIHTVDDMYCTTDYDPKKLKTWRKELRAHIEFVAEHKTLLLLDRNEHPLLGKNGAHDMLLEAGFAPELGVVEDTIFKNEFALYFHPQSKSWVILHTPFGMCGDSRVFINIDQTILRNLTLAVFLHVVNYLKGKPAPDMDSRWDNPLLGAFYFEMVYKGFGQAKRTAAAMHRDAITPEIVNAIHRYAGSKSNNNPEYPLCRRNRNFWFTHGLPKVGTVQPQRVGSQLSVVLCIFCKPTDCGKLPEFFNDIVSDTDLLQLPWYKIFINRVVRMFMIEGNQVNMISNVRQWTDRTFMGKRAEWQTGYAGLVKYKEQHGNCRVPRRYGPLCAWVNTQRGMRRKEDLLGTGNALLPLQMLPLQIELLDDLNFTWKVLDAQWEANYQQLAAYREQHGNCRVPQSYGPLGEWVKWLRLRRNRNRSADLSPLQIELLDDLDFIWNVDDAVWEANYNELAAYKEQHGDCLVAPSYGPLGSWVTWQRQSRKKNRLSLLVQIELLNDLEFCWDPLIARWKVKYLELVAYKEQHGDCLVPGVNCCGPLGNWVYSMQRRQNARSAILPFQFDLLDELEFTTW